MPSVAFQGYRDDGLRLVTGNRACEVCSVGFTARSHARTCSPRRRQGEDDDESVPIGHADPSFRPQRRYPPAVPGLRSNWRATIPPLMSATLHREHWNGQPTHVGDLFRVHKMRGDKRLGAACQLWTHALG